MLFHRIRGCKKSALLLRHTYTVCLVNLHCYRTMTRIDYQKQLLLQNVYLIRPLYTQMQYLDIFRESQQKIKERLGKKPLVAELAGSVSCTV